MFERAKNLRITGYIFAACALIYMLNAPVAKAAPPDNFKQLSQNAQSGDAVSQFKLGTYYLKAHDMDKAVHWLTEAAKNKNAGAENNLGFMYEKGFGLPRDKTQALKHYENAAKLKLPEAYINLGLIYAHGELVKEDPDKAVSWFQKAADAGLAEGYFHLAPFYLNGKAVLNAPKDEKKAVELLEKAAAQNHCDSIYALGLMTATGKGMPKDKILARDKILNAAKCGSATAQSDVVYSYMRGQHKRIDNDTAFAYAQNAAKSYPRAQVLLSQLYLKGWPHGKIDVPMAWAWMKLGYENGIKGAGAVVAQMSKALNAKNKMAEAQQDYDNAKLTVLVTNGSMLAE